MRAAFFIVCVLGFGFSAVDSIASREAIERNTAMFQRYNEQYEKSELFKEYKITKFCKLIDKIKKADLTVSFFDDNIDSMLRDNGLEPCLFIKCRWGAELLSDLVKCCCYDYALMVENFLLNKMNEAEFLPVSSMPFDFECKLLECMSKTNTPALNKYLISPYGEIKHRCFYILEKMGDIWGRSPVKVSEDVKENNPFWYFFNLVVGSDRFVSSFIGTKYNFTDLATIGEFLSRKPFNEYCIIKSIGNDLTVSQLLCLSEVFVNDWHVVKPGFWRESFGILGDSVVNEGNELNESFEKEIINARGSLSERLGISLESAGLEQIFAMIFESGLKFDTCTEEKWQTTAEELIPYCECVPECLINQIRNFWVLSFRYNRLRYYFEILKTDSDEKKKETLRQIEIQIYGQNNVSIQEQIEVVKKDYIIATVCLKCMLSMEKSSCLQCYVFLRDWCMSNYLDDDCEIVDRDAVAGFARVNLHFFYGYLKELHEKSKVIISDLFRTLSATVRVIEKVKKLGYFHSFDLLIEKIKEVLKMVISESLWKEIESFERECKGFVKGKTSSFGGDVFERKIMEKIEDSLKVESDNEKKIVETAKLIIAKNLLVL